MFHITLKSANSKVGPIPVTTSSRKFCPDACPLKGGPCYAESGPLALHWNKVTDGSRGITLTALCATIAALPEGQLWRHNQAGDLPGDGKYLNEGDCRALVEANRGRNGFTYTHYSPWYARNSRIILGMNQGGFTVNLSADTLTEADKLASLNIGPVVVLLPADQAANCTTPRGRKVVVCPATQREDVSCSTCKLCSRQRETIVGFPAHGPRKGKVFTVVFAKKGD